MREWICLHISSTAQGSIASSLALPSATLHFPIALLRSHPFLPATPHFPIATCRPSPPSPAL
ncbi:hypothetical protein VKT23_015596 [Stygiomarasmius scandens]|uniref:Uncharacterized protein n=1 Tax=Marasmiellus scandens TaxID=2682957 RepID=A0ABR1J0U5_9AGAR